MTNSHGDDWQWRSIDGETRMGLHLTNLNSKRDCIVFFSKFELCLTGQGLEYLLRRSKKSLLQILPYVRVFARMSPKQKERIITDLKSCGYITLMCGDGTNDVGALKHSHVGVALLSHPYDATKTTSERTKKLKLMKRINTTITTTNHQTSLNNNKSNNRASNISEAQARKLDVLLPPSKLKSQN